MAVSPASAETTPQRSARILPLTVAFDQRAADAFGTAVNKLDGAGRYQAWMRAESVRLQGEYASFVADCLADAGAPASAVRLQAKQLKGL